MFQELGAGSGGGAAWKIASMLFFLAVWVGVAVWVLRSRREDMDARARLPLEDGEKDSGVRSQESVDEDQESGRGPDAPPES